MKKKKYAFFVTLIVALALLFVLDTCDMGYSGADVVNAALPTITEQPRNVSVDIDEKVDLTVVVSVPEGVPQDLHYQWYKFTTFIDYDTLSGEALENETSATFTPSTAEEGEANYYVIISNNNPGATGLKISSVKSDPVKVAVNDPENARYPIITQQPSYTGGNLVWNPRIIMPTLEVIAVVDPEDKSDEIRYQWYKTDSLNNNYGLAIKGATASRLIPPVVVQGEEPEEGQIFSQGTYYYFVVVTNYYFDVTGRRESSIASSPIVFNIGTNPNAATPVINKHPASAIYFNGDTVAGLKVTVDEPEDGGTVSYQWFSNSSLSNTGGSVISGASTDTLALTTDTATPKDYYYYVVVTNTNNYATIKTATVTSRVAEINVTTPSTKTANATFSVQTGGTLQYQYVRGFGGMDVTWGNFPNYNNPALPSPLNFADDYETMFNPDILGYNMVRIMVLPTYTDINRTLDELVHNQIYTSMDRTRFYENVKTVNRYDGYVLASPWSPPAAWKTNNSINGGGDLRESDYQNFANYLKAFAQNMLNNGAPIYAISISNEPNYTAGYDGCEWTGTQMRNFYRDMGHFTDGVPGYGGGKMLPSVRTMNGESANTTTINQEVMQNSVARRSVDLLARHNYGSRNENGAGTGNTPTHNWIYSSSEPKEIWMTEHNLNSNSGITYPNDHTWNYIWLFMNDVDMSIRINHESAFIWWSAKRFYSMIGDGTYGCKDSEILPRGWGLAHYAKFAKETYRTNVSYSGRTKNGVNLAEYDRTTGNGNMNGNHYADFASETVKVTAYVKLRGGEIYPVNWRDRSVPVTDIEEITMVMFTPTKVDGTGGYDMGTVRLQMPRNFRIASATAMRSDPEIFHRGTTERGTPQWETVEISADRNSAFVELPRSTILSVRFTQ